MKKETQTEEKKEKTKKSREKIVFVKAKKKSAAARATIKKGTGKVTINKKTLEYMQPEIVKGFIEEPLKLSGELAKQVDIIINAKGSGVMSQAVASRACIAKGLVKFFNDTKLKNAYLAYDRMLLVDDFRRVETKKPLGKKARSQKQKSKR